MGDSIHIPLAKSLAAFLIVSLLICVTLLSSGCATPAASVQSPPVAQGEITQNKSSHVPALYAVTGARSVPAMARTM